jgi:energy-coupling factor transporter ATP-binding protein EcfA2
MKTRYNYYEIFHNVKAMGKQLFGQQYDIDDTDRPVVLKLITYFLQDENIASEYNIDLCKGLIITGPTGCGKTAILRILRALMPQPQKFPMHSCVGIGLQFRKEGYKVIERYGIGSFEPYVNTPRPVCFNDLGFEKNIDYFGKDINVMADIFFHRYDLFMEHHMLTHITTNLASKELEERYGNVIRSRIRQMCNLINFSTDSKDKRL